MPSNDSVTESHSGLSLEEYKRRGYVLKIGKRGPYFEKVGPGPAQTSAPSATIAADVTPVRNTFDYRRLMEATREKPPEQPRAHKPKCSGCNHGPECKPSVLQSGPLGSAVQTSAPRPQWSLLRATGTVLVLLAVVWAIVNALIGSVVK